MAELTDAEVISLARSSDPQQFEHLFRRHFRVIYTYLYRRLGAPAASDLAADTFVKALESIDSYDTDMPDARPWLYGIATNLILNHRRTENRRLAAYARAAARLSTSSEGESAETLALAGELSAVLSEALATLPAPDRDVLLLFAWAELSYVEIAIALDIPVGTVRSRLHRARRHVRELLDRRRRSTDQKEVLR
ncbi:MAG: RNA polymerase sigma factor [Actinomycetota bacterium]